jgi:hypothetical protein
VLTIASGPAGVVAAVARVAAAGRDPRLASRCRALAGRNSWDSRAGAFAAALGIGPTEAPQPAPRPLEVP